MPTILWYQQTPYILRTCIFSNIQTTTIFIIKLLQILPVYWPWIQTSSTKNYPTTQHSLFAWKVAYQHFLVENILVYIEGTAQNQRQYNCLINHFKNIVY